MSCRIEENVRLSYTRVPTARAVWKKFVSPEDCVSEYERWAAQVNKAK